MRIAVLILSVALPLVAHAGALLPVSGRLLGAGDTPVEGTNDLTFRIWSVPAPNLPGGQVAVWTQTQAVTATAGLFSALLGDPDTGGVAIPDTAFDGPRWLSITIANTELLPRQRVGIMPAALRADRAALALDLQCEGCVKAAALADDAVGARALADDAVGPDAIADGAVWTAHLADASVTSIKLATGAVTAPALAAGAVGSTAIAAGAVQTDHLAAASITADRLAAGAVGDRELATGAVKGRAIEDGAITNAKIAAGTLTADRLAPGRFAGLDADKLDGLDAAAFARVDATTAQEGGLKVTGAVEAGSFTGSGAGLSNVDAAKVAGMLLGDLKNFTCDAGQVLNGFTFDASSARLRPSCIPLPIAQSGTQTSPAGRSCREIREKYAIAASGNYWIDPDATGPDTAVNVYCEMAVDGGGWTVCYAANSTVAPSVTVTGWHTRSNTTAYGAGEYSRACKTMTAAFGSHASRARVTYVDGGGTQTTIGEKSPPPDLANGTFNDYVKVSGTTGSATSIGIEIEAPTNPGRSHCFDEASEDNSWGRTDMNRSCFLDTSSSGWYDGLTAVEYWLK